MVLELGGSDPFIVLDSADLEQAAAVGTTARMLNNGQSCIAAKRFIVVDSVADQFTELLLAKFAALKVGDPLMTNADIGPLATSAILTELVQQVERCLSGGARALIGGEALPGQGNYYPPTLLTDIPLDSAIAKEEFFWTRCFAISCSRSG